MRFWVVALLAVACGSESDGRGSGGTAGSGGVAGSAAGGTEAGTGGSAGSTGGSGGADASVGGSSGVSGSSSAGAGGSSGSATGGSAGTQTGGSGGIVDAGPDGPVSNCDLADGWGDCDGIVVNGDPTSVGPGSTCETQLNKKESCGFCGNACTTNGACTPLPSGCYHASHPTAEFGCQYGAQYQSGIVCP